MSVLQKLKSNGTLALYHDYRSRSFYDWSGNGNAGDPTGVLFTGRGISAPGSSSYVESTTFSTSAFTDMSAVAVVLPNSVTGQRVLISKWMSSLEFLFDLNSGKPRLIVSADGVGATGIQEATTALTVGSMYTIGFTYDATAQTVVLYVDGLVVPSSVVSGSIPTSLNSGSDNLRVGATGSGFFDGMIDGAIMVDGAMTASEHKKIYLELRNLSWPTKTVTKSSVNLSPNPNDPALIAGYDMSFSGTTLKDLSANGNDASGAAGVANVRGLMGNSISFDGTTGRFLIPDSPSLDIPAGGEVTLSTWLKPYSVNANREVYRRESGTDRILFSIQGGDTFGFGTYGTSYSELDYTSFDSSYVGIWSHVVATHASNGDRHIYINGVSVVNDNVTNGITHTGAIFGEIGTYSAGVEWYDGEIAAFAIHSEAKDADWVAYEYARGQYALSATSWGSNESVSTITSGPLENSGFHVVSGTFEVEVETLDGNPVKAVHCVASGDIRLPTGFVTPNLTGVYRTGAGAYSRVALSPTAGVLTMATNDRLLLGGMSDLSNSIIKRPI